MQLNSYYVPGASGSINAGGRLVPQNNDGTYTALDSSSESALSMMGQLYTPSIHNQLQPFLAGDIVSPESMGRRVYTLTASDLGRTIANSGALPLWVFIPPGLPANLGFKVAQRGRGRVYVCPGAGVELNGVVGVGRWSTCRRGQSISVDRVGPDAYSANLPRRDVIHAGASDYFTIDGTGATYTVTGSQTYAFSIEPLLATPDVYRPQWAYVEPLVRAFPAA